jgi:hypothetical protein
LHLEVLAGVILVFIAATLEKVLEAGSEGWNIHSCADALWWAGITITTGGTATDSLYDLQAEPWPLCWIIGIGLVELSPPPWRATSSVSSETRPAAVDARLATIEALHEPQMAAICPVYPASG